MDKCTFSSESRNLCYESAYIRSCLEQYEIGAAPSCSILSCLVQDTKLSPQCFLFADCKNECAKRRDFWVYTNGSAWDWERKTHRGIEQTKGISLSFFVPLDNHFSIDSGFYPNGIYFCYTYAQSFYIYAHVLGVVYRNVVFPSELKCNFILFQPWYIYVCVCLVYVISCVFPGSYKNWRFKSSQDESSNKCWSWLWQCSCYSRKHPSRIHWN